MHRSVLWAAVGMFCAVAAPLRADSTPGPPDWNDGRGSVYQAMSQPAPATFQPAAEAQPIAAPAVETAVHLAPAQSAAEARSRILAPPSGRLLANSSDEKTLAPQHERRASARGPFDFGLPLTSIYTMCTALAIVIGAFLLFTWLLRRGTRVASSVLPPEVVSVLGRVSLTARQVAELLRVGNKLVLVSITPTGAETLTEVTDPAEVERLLGLCQQYNPHSTTKTFEHVFRQLSGEPASNSFLTSDSLPPTLSSAAAAYRSHRGEPTRA